MFDLHTLDDLSLLAESVELECKLAQGADGKGELPKDFWPTYSAMANNHGGVVLLGVREKPQGVFSIAGLDNPTKVRTDLFNTLNNASKVSVNLLDDAHVNEAVVDGRTILIVQIPAATRKQKPVFLNGQPLGNTYRRQHEGDRRCDDETVKRMLAEQLEDSRDNRILNHFGVKDVDIESLHAYRNAFASHRPDHPWGQVDDLEFLRLTHAWRESRETGEQGLTIAGLLMFGTWTSISEALPLYFLDYQEQPADTSQTRWLDRVVPDGSWSGNLFDFYRRVIRKLTADLKVPFVLKGDTRVDDTPIHQALREALVNTLIHADYSDRASVLVIKSPAGFVFRNPGLMRVAPALALEGGASDCRNRTLHQLFLLINLGERAGSGLPKIRSGWEVNGHSLSLTDSIEPFDQTRLEMLWANKESMAAKHINEAVSPKTPGKTPGKTPERILELIAQNAHASIPELALALDKSESAIERAIRKLKTEGRLHRIGSAKGGYWEIKV
ncbi:MAG: putative DNA binding domain-containing protein [Cellvibrio sp.]|uniref:RNA-binding domain-containing protein n=1 Tax=Cellvibrio sp. TaxID=1965322 RepID=UPI00271AA519|nr:putative DNA binding domain-containing protein [Cellvibrio sp.]